LVEIVKLKRPELNGYDDRAAPNAPTILPRSMLDPVDKQRIDESNDQNGEDNYDGNDGKAGAGSICTCGHEKRAHFGYGECAEGTCGCQEFFLKKEEA